MLTVVRKIWVVVLIAWAACFSTMALRADEADDQFTVAAGHYDRGRWKLAIDEFRTFTEKYPNNRRANQSVFFLGEALLQLGKFDEARQHFQSYVDREPNGKYIRTAYFRIGEAAYLAGDFKTAKPDLERFLAKYPTDQLNAFVLPYLGDVALGKNDTEAAIGYFRDGLKRFPEGRLQNDCRMGLARALLKLNRPGEAFEQFDAVLAAAGSAGNELSQQAACGKVQAALQMKDYDAVDREAAQFEKRFPNGTIISDVRRMLARSLVERRQYARAVALLESLTGGTDHAGHLGQQDLEDRYLLAISYVALKKYAEAAATFDAVLKNNPPEAMAAEALYERAWALRELGKAKDADRLFERLCKEYPQSRFRADAAYRLARRALDTKNYERAGALVNELLAAKADLRVREHAAYLRGRIAVAKADWPKAQEAFEALVKEFPETEQRPMAEFWVAEAYYRQGDYKAADARLERLAGRIPQENREPWMAIIPLRRAQALAKQKQWSEAYAIAAKIEKEYPDFEQQYEVDYLIGRYLADQADFEAARRAYNKVIRSTAGAKTETAAMAQWMIGETFFHQKNYQAALREYLRLEILYDAYPTWQAAALLEAGKCHQRLGEATQAAELYRRIMKVYPHTPFAERAARQLTVLGKKTSYTLHGLK